MKSSEPRTELPDPGRICTVGVHLDLDSLRVVEVGRGRIVRWFSEAYPSGQLPGSKEFPAFLKSRLGEFCSVLRHTSIWLVGPTPSLQMRFLALPKARPRQLANMVYWTFRKEIPFDAAQTVFDYDAEGVDPAMAGTSKKTDVTAYTVAQAEVAALTDMFESVGVHVDGILLPSFAMRNLFRNQSAGSHAAETAMALYVGEDSSSIMFVKGKHVVSHRLFKTGMNVMLDAVRDRHPDWSAAQAYHAIRAAFAGGPPAADGTAGPATEEIDSLKETVRLAFGRLVQQVERSLSAYLVGRDEGVKEIHVAGAMAGLAPLVEELGSRLGVKSGPLDLFRAHRFAGREAGAWSPEEAGQMALALGAALSDKSQSPNLIYTYVKRHKEARGIRAKQLLVGLGAIAAALMLGGSRLASQANGRMHAELEACLQNVRRIVPRTDRAAVQAISDRAAQNSAQLKAMARRHLPAAALNQLARLTPEDIRLISATWEPGEAANAGKRAKKKTAGETDSPIRFHLEGLVLGEIGVQESKLASYQMRLEDAELFGGVSLLRSEAGTESGEPVLLFALEMQMDDLAGPSPSAPPAPAAGGGP
jgi:Tfp pilus assembly PilM family ATPase